MKTDLEIRDAVLRQLAADPDVEPQHIGVSVREGIVTLSGHPDTYPEKFAVERDASHVDGVRGLAIDMIVQLWGEVDHDAASIALAVEGALRHNVLLPRRHLRIKVERGGVSLTGRLPWEFQRRAAERAVLAVEGVTSVANFIELDPPRLSSPSPEPR